MANLAPPAPGTADRASMSVNDEHRASVPLDLDSAELHQKLFNEPPPVADTQPKTMGDLMNLFARHKGVVAVMLMNRQGLIIKSTNEEKGISGFYCGFAKQILDNLVDPIEDVNPSKIQVIRVASSIQELLISPIEDMDIIFVILQNIRDRPAEKNLCFVDPQKHKLAQQQLSGTF